MTETGTGQDPLDAIKALGAELTAAKQGVRDAFTRIRDVKTRIAAAKKALVGITATKKTGKPRLALGAKPTAKKRSRKGGLPPKKDEPEPVIAG